MRPGEVLDAQIDLLDRVEGDEIFRQVLNNWSDLELSAIRSGQKRRVA
jgi:hypothetical protein